MKKLIISKSIIFLIVMVFINVFIKIFGSSNTLIGVTVITATLMFLERDLTVEPIKNILKLLGINLLLGVLSFLAVQNIILGVIINFSALFIVGYLFTYDLKKPMYIAFGLQYLFMVSKPVTIEEMPIRLLALAFGALVIMAPQFLINKNKLEKSSKKIFTSTCDQLLSKINKIRNKEDLIEVNSSIEKNINTLKQLLYDNRKDEFYLTDRAIDILNMGLALERISYVLDNYVYNIYDTKQESLQEMYSEIKNLKLYIEKEESIEYNIDLDSIKDISLCEFYNILINIHDYFDEYKKHKHNFNKDIDCGNVQVQKEFNKKNFSKECVRFSYAIKVALATSIAGFIMDYFKLSEGRWIMFTVFSVIQPYSENCIIKSKKRIQGTLIGGVIIFVLFSIIKDSSLRGLVIICAGYLSGYANDYRDSMICNTISAIGSVAIIGNVEVLLLNRIIFVLLGIGIGLVINKYVLPYDTKKGYNYLIQMYENVSMEMLKETRLSVQNKNNSYRMKNLLLIPALIEEKIDSMQVNNKEEREFIKNKKYLASNVYNLYVNINRNNIKDDKVKNALQEMNCISDVEEAKYLINNTEDMTSKVVCKNILQINNILRKDRKKITV